MDVVTRFIWQPTPVFLPGKFLGQRSLAGLESMRSQRVRHDLATEANNCSKHDRLGYTVTERYSILHTKTTKYFPHTKHIRFTTQGHVVFTRTQTNKKHFSGSILVFIVAPILTLLAINDTCPFCSYLIGKSCDH